MKTIALAFVCGVAVLLAPVQSARAESAENGSETTSQLRARRPVKMERPQWGIQAAAAPVVFGGTSIVPLHPEASSLGTSLQFEYQPAFLQSLGTFGIGPALGIYPMSRIHGVTDSFFSCWSYGAVARYQARYVPKQIVVPSLGYQLERMSYDFNNGSSGWITLSGPFAGIQLLLNALDPSRGEDLYSSSGIMHTYLLAEARYLTGDNQAIAPTGLSWYFGLRFEL